MRKTPWYYFNIAAERATRSVGKNYRLAALAIRNDGVMVCSVNGNPKHPNPSSHAERRLCRKLDKAASVFVVRVGAKGEYRLSRPCAGCIASMRNNGVKRVCYTISDTEYGIIDF